LDVGLASLDSLFFFDKIGAKIEMARATIWISSVTGSIFVDNMDKNINNIVHKSAWYNLG